MSYVLIVDDDVAVAQAISNLVSLFDWEARIVHGPRSAIMALQKEPPALILLDLNIPGVDGLEVCRYIKRDPLARDIAVVFVTAEDDPGMVEKARQAGAMDYLVKPIDVDRLEEILKRLPQQPPRK